MSKRRGTLRVRKSKGKSKGKMRIKKQTRVKSHKHKSKPKHKRSRRNINKKYRHRSGHRQYTRSKGAAPFDFTRNKVTEINKSSMENDVNKNLEELHNKLRILKEQEDETCRESRDILKQIDNVHNEIVIKNRMKITLMQTSKELKKQCEQFAIETRNALKQIERVERHAEKLGLSPQYFFGIHI